MTTAGRILIIPKGDYDASVNYEMLDLVKHGGTSWLCKKACTGKEPTTDNSEFWQNMFDAEAFIDARIEAKVKEYMEKNQ
jgi:hypothetical protein